MAPLLLSLARATLPTLVMFSIACDVSPQASPFAFDEVGAPPSVPHDDTPEPATPEPDDSGTAPEPETGDATGLRVFVTSLTYTADLGGLVGADEICQFEAEGAQLSGTWRAWISDGSTDAIDRITGDGPWLDIAGTRLFNNHAHLRTAPLAAIALDPFGQPNDFERSVWTGTAAGGRRTGADACGDWTTEDWARDAGAGLTVSGGHWTDAGPLPCEWDARLYCFEVG